jgi:hypothetical protein
MEAEKRRAHPPTRAAYAHDAVLDLDPGGDDAAPGGAITVALCGSWSHEPPCPLAPHHTRAHRSGTAVTLRLLFAAEPEDEPRVRALVEEALDRGWGDGPDGARTAWQLVWAAPSPVLPEEEEHAQRLIRS